MKFYVYILYNKKYDKFYIGQTNNLEARISEHNHSMNKSGYTAKLEGEWKVVYNENLSSRTEAIKRERFLKKQKNKSFCKRLYGV